MFWPSSTSTVATCRPLTNIPLRLSLSTATEWSSSNRSTRCAPSQWIGDAQISADVAADSHIFPRGEGVCRPAVPDGSSGAAGWVIGNHSHRRTPHRARLGPLRW